MARNLELANGQHIGMAIAEVTAIPFFSLFDKDLERANNMNQVLFTQLISAFHRKSEANFATLELFWQSVAVDNQTYKAQVKLHVIVRKIGSDKDAVAASVDSMMQASGTIWRTRILLFPSLRPTRNSTSLNVLWEK